MLAIAATIPHLLVPIFRDYMERYLWRHAHFSASVVLDDTAKRAMLQKCLNDRRFSAGLP